MAYKSTQITFQNSFSVSYDNIIQLHHFVFIFLLGILIFVIYLLSIVLKPFFFLNFYKLNFLNFFYMKKIYIYTTKIRHNSKIELIWTIIPSLIIACLLLPSFNLLYSVSESFFSNITVKAIGHQWYRSYEFNYSILSFFYYYFLYFNNFFLDNFYYNISIFNIHHFLNNYIQKIIISFDSSINTESNVLFRLLDVDNFLILPSNFFIKFLTTSDDVIHSFAIPALGLKMDSVPGRLNEMVVFVKREGQYIGQCSEICGINHAYMPINILFLEPKLFYKMLIQSLKFNFYF